MNNMFSRIFLHQQPIRFAGFFLLRNTAALGSAFPAKRTGGHNFPTHGRDHSVIVSTNYIKYKKNHCITYNTFYFFLLVLLYYILIFLKNIEISFILLGILVLIYIIWIKKDCVFECTWLGTDRMFFLYNISYYLGNIFSVQNFQDLRNMYAFSNSCYSSSCSWRV